MDLIKRIEADKAEGVDLKVRYFGGGPLAFQDMLNRNADFAVAGAPALAGFKARGEPVVSIATVSRTPAYVLMVRTSLKGKVKRIADLKGRVIGVNTSSVKAKSTSQLTAEFLLRRDGVRVDQVNFVPAGQNLEEQAAALDSGAVDALMGDEPFATRFREQGKVFILEDLSSLDSCRKWLGGLLLSGQLATRADVLRNEPDKTERMVRVLRRSLLWIASHSAEEVVARLALPDGASRAAMKKVLRRHKAMYSPDGVSATEEIHTADRFFRESNPSDPTIASFSFNSMVDTRWAGLSPR